MNNARRLILKTPEIRDRAASLVAGLPANADKPLEVIVRPYRKNRSLAQNACLHGWCTAIAKSYEEAFGERKSPETFKEYLKGLFLGEESSEVMGKTVTTTRHTADLSVVEFRDFLDAVDRWAVEQLQLFLPRGADYEEAMQP